MSVKVMGQVWELDLPHNKVLLLLAMADHADHEGKHVHPSVELLAWKTGYEERQVRRILRTLEKDGLLVVEKAGGGRNKTTEYRIDIAKGVKKSPFRKEDIITPNSQIGGHFDRVNGHNEDILTGNQAETGTFATQNGDIAMSPESSLEPSVENQEKDPTDLSSSGPGSEPAIPSSEAGKSPKKPRKPKVVTPIPREHWLWPLLEEYREEFDLAALDDWAWWETFVKTFPDGIFTRNFVIAALANMSRWLQDNPKHRPRSVHKWHQRIVTSFEFFLQNIYLKRQPKAAQPGAQANGLTNKAEARAAYNREQHRLAIEETQERENTGCGAFLQRLGSPSNDV